MEMPHIVEGEVIAIQEPLGGQGKKIFYTVEAYLPTGAMVNLVNCQQASLFGGIGDYYRRRLRSRSDTEYPSADADNALKDSNRKASVGERVIVAFLNGSLNWPIIIGHLQHPNQTEEGVEPVDDSGGVPRSVMQYNGVRQTIDEDGQYRIIRKGSPSLSFVPTGEEPFGASAVASGTPGNPALAPASSSETTAFEMLNGGVTKWRDASGGSMTLSPGTIKITNNGGTSFSDIGAFGEINLDALGAIGDTESVDAILDAFSSEYIEISDPGKSLTIHARDLLKFEASDTRYDFTKGDHIVSVIGGLTFGVVGSVTSNVGGDINTTVAGNILQSTGGQTTLAAGTDFALAAGGEFVISASGGITTASAGNTTLSAGGNMNIFGGGTTSIKTIAGAGLNISGGTVALGGPGGELLDLVDQLMDKLNTLIGAMKLETHIGNLGYSTGIPEAPEITTYSSVESDIATIKATLGTIKGGL